MTLKIQKSLRRNIIKSFLVIITVFVLGFGSLYTWFVHNSNRLLIDLVNQKSAGTLKLELSHVTFNLFSNEVKIHRALISSTGKTNTPITYKVSFQKISLTTNSLWSALYKSSLDVRKLKLYDPVIEVFNGEKDINTASKNNLSLGGELGKLYHSVNDAISALNTHSISLINAKLILNNKSSPGKRPLIFSNIYFTLTKLHKNRDFAAKYLKENDVVFSSSNQEITFTDGTHKLLFKRLAIQRGRNIILDSCTILTLPTRISRSSYTINFKRLALIGVDFNALYKTNLIKADSVYCENPFFNINLNAGLPDSNSGGRGIPDLQKIIKQFAGNLDLGFTGVMDADIYLNVTRKKTQSNIHSGKVNFQIKNLRINADSLKPVSVRNFDMLIKGYQLYNADSTCVYSFDSIRFANDRLLLNNFSVNTSSGMDKVRNFRNYSIPYFELLGMDWPELIFKQSLKAREAILHEPIINYRKMANVNLSKKSIIFNTRHSLGDFMEISRFQIINGQINIDWSNRNSLQLDGLDIGFLGNDLTNYKHVSLQKDIESLFFRNGFLKVGDITARLQNVNFTANNQIKADHLLINSNLAGIDSKIDDVSIKNIYAEENTGRLVVDGLNWKQGSITVNPIYHTKSKRKRTSVLLNNVSGKQTQLKILNDATEANAFIEEVQFSSLAKNHNEPIILQRLRLKGREMNLFTTSIRMNFTSFVLSDNLQQFSGTRLESKNNAGTLVINVPSLRLKNDINSFFANNLHFSNILLESPSIDFKKQQLLSVNEHMNKQMPGIKIDNITFHEPVVNVQADHTLSNVSFSFPYSKGSEIKIGGVQIASGGIRISALDIKTGKAEIIKGKEKVFGIDKEVNLKLSDIDIPASGNSRPWNAIVKNLKVKNTEGLTFKIKENTLVLKDISLGDCQFSSSSLNDISKLISSNHALWLSTSSAKYTTKNSLLQFINIRYNAGNNLLVLDSFNCHPSMSRDSLIAATPYQTDYISFRSGNTKLYGFDVGKYIKDDSIYVQKAIFSNPSINIYRDKLPPFIPGIRKKLFTENIRAITSPVSIYQIGINNGTINYTEKNDKSRLEGNLFLTKLNGNIFNIKNHGVKGSDSLSLALTGNLLDASYFDLKINQSYFDSLYGFIIDLNIEPGSILFLNSLLAPLSNINFTSGNIDKFTMHARANETVAYGEMIFHYRDLRIKLLKNGGLEKSNFTRRVAGTLINTFVLKRNNQERTGLIYFKRLKDRSFFNYMIKMINSGVATSVGAKKNNRYRKNFKKENIPE